MEEIIERISSTASKLMDTERAAILSDKASLSVIADYVDERAKSYRNCAKFLRSLPVGKEICVLLDCDVILSYLQPENTLHENALLARHFFEKSNYKYAIPVGAFEELLDKISERIGLPNQPITTREFMNPKEAVFSILGVLREDAADPFFIREIENKTDNRIFRLHRLLNILGNKERFKGVYRRFSKELQELATAFVEDERGGPMGHFDTNPKPHDKNDKNDGKNLAVALHPYSEQSGAEEHRVLMTLTGTVVRAGKRLANQQEVSRGSWFVAYPKYILTTEVLGSKYDSQKSIVRDKLNDLNRELTTLGNLYYQQIEKVDAGVLSKADTENLVTETARTLRNVKANGMEAIESTREPIISSRIGDSNLGGQLAGGRRVGHPRFSSYLRLLSRLRSEIHELDADAYFVLKTESPSPSDVETYKIGVESEDGKFDEFLEVNIYKAGGQLDLWTAQWDLDVNERRFFESIYDAFGDYEAPADKGSSGEFEMKVNPEITSELWNQGIVVATGFSIFGLGLGSALAGKTWLDLSFMRLRQIIAQNSKEDLVSSKSFLHKRSELSTGLAIKEPPATHQSPAFTLKTPIEEVRVNLRQADLVFEIFPSAGNRQRFTILSSQPIFEEVALFYDWLGIKLARKSALRQKLQELFTPFYAGGEHV